MMLYTLLIVILVIETAQEFTKLGYNPYMMSIQLHLNSKHDTTSSRSVLSIIISGLVNGVSWFS